MDTDNRSYLQRLIDGRLDRTADERTRQFVQDYADGGRDEALAYRIRREVHRRAAMSKELDIYEPLRWTGVSFVLTALAGALVKATTEKSVSKPALITLTASTALGSAIQLVRLMPRYEAALKGGADTACAMHQFDVAHHGDASVKALVKSRGDDPWVKRVSDAALDTKGRQIH